MPPPGLVGEEPTFRVSELGEELRDLLRTAFSSVWVTGEIQRLRPSRRGHLYFELVEKGGGDTVVGKIDAVLWRTDHLRVNRNLRANRQRLEEGQEIRCRGQIDFYGPAGRLQLIVRDVDPLFTLGRLAQRRQETLAALARAGLTERNRERALAPVPLDLLLLTSIDSAAYHDVLSGLAASGYGFRVWAIDTMVQGEGAERSLCAAFDLVRRVVEDPRPQAPHPRAVLLVRGGGARSDLAAFDSRRVAEAVARCPVPVLAGLGHEIDETVVDQICHRSLKTPTEAATFVVMRVAEAEQAIIDLHAAIASAAERTLRDARRALRGSERVARAATLRLAVASKRVDGASRGLALVADHRLREAKRLLDRHTAALRHGAPRALERRRPRAGTVATAIAQRAKTRLAHHHALLDGWERLCRQLMPDRQLERGFSITRDQAGRLVRNTSQVAEGEALMTEIATGKISSIVRIQEEP